MLFHDWLKDDSKIVLFDGGMGSEIFKRGIIPGKLPDTINIDNPHIVYEIHKEYYDVGADMCQSNTFGASFLNLQIYKLENQIKEINQGALETIKKACPPNRLIVGDVGPSGEFRPPVGKATSDQWVSSFARQADILKDGVDLWHIETMSDIEEMKAKEPPRHRQPEYNERKGCRINTGAEIYIGQVMGIHQEWYGRSCHQGERLSTIHPR